VIGERTKNNSNPPEKGDEYTKIGILSALIKTTKYKTKQQTTNKNTTNTKQLQRQIYTHNEGTNEPTFPFLNGKEHS
jgi:hypothetical protein